MCISKANKNIQISLLTPVKLMNYNFAGSKLMVCKHIKSKSDTYNFDMLSLVGND